MNSKLRIPLCWKDRAASVLSPDQLAIFRRDQAARLEASKGASEMVRQMLGGAQPAAK